MKWTHLALCTLVLTALAVALPAQSQPVLTFNGHMHASAPVNRSLDMQLDANPGSVAFILFNVSPGPTPFLGQQLPIAVDQNLVVGVQNLVMPPSGVANFMIPVSNNPALEGITIYAFALTFDQNLPSGFGFSNAADFTFVKEPLAGNDTAGWVDRDITLDGGATLAPGPLTNGIVPSWSITQGPAGHNAQLTGADTLFPTLTADLPGTYTVTLDLLAPGTSGGASDDVQVDVFALTNATHAHGDFDPADPITFSATLAGPTPTMADVNGQPAGAMGALSVTQPAGSPFNEFFTTITAAGGQVVGRPITVVSNPGGSLAAPPVDSLLTHIRQPIVDDIELVIEQAVALVNLSGPITGILPINVVNIPGLFGTTLFSADVTPTGFSYDPAIMVDITLNAGAAHVQLTLNNVQFTFDIMGLIFNAPYTDAGTLTSSSVTIDFDLTLAAVNGAFESTISNETATINGATLTFQNGVIPNNFASTLLGAVVPVIEPLIATTITAGLAPALDSALSLLPQMIDLSPQGLDVVVDLPASGVDHLAGGLTFKNAAGGHASQVPATAPLIPAYFETPSAAPSFTGVVPGGTTPYRLAFSVGDDFLNQLLAAATQAGALETVNGTSLTLSGMTVNADAGSLATALPGLGFEDFDPAAAVEIVTRPTLAPVVRIQAGGPDAFSMTVSALEIDFRVQVAPNYQASVLRVSLDAEVGLNVVLDPVASTLDLVPGTVTATAHPLDSLPGVDVSGQLGMLSGLINGALPGLLTGLTGLPLPAPSTGAPLSLVGLGPDGPAGDYLSLYFD